MMTIAAWSTPLAALVTPVVVAVCTDSFGAPADARRRIARTGIDLGSAPGT